MQMPRDSGMRHGFRIEVVGFGISGFRIQVVGFMDLGLRDLGFRVYVGFRNSGASEP